MRLNELLKYPKITLQCHDNPDADALASAFALSLYFKEKGIDVKIIYGGRSDIKKASLKLMIEKLGIDIEYISDKSTAFEGLLICVDCQCGESNVTPFKAGRYAIVDHHIEAHSGVDDNLKEIQSELGSCSTLVWKMLRQEEFSINEYENLGTALYYGLLSDTNNFTELKNQDDRDMLENLIADKKLISLFSNSNITLDELRIAGNALNNYVYNEDYRYAMIHTESCDANLLGLINDFVLQVDIIDVSVVYNTASDGYKLSIRSCDKESRADSVIAFLTQNIGGGGGHDEKAGGFISRSRLISYFGEDDIGSYISNRLNQFFESR